MLNDLQTILNKGTDRVNLTVYRDTRVFDDLRAEWNELLHRSPADSVFSTWEWAKAWWEAYHPGELWVITCRDADNKLLGIAPWFIKAEDGARVVQTIGSIDVTDYLDVIVDGSCTSVVLECLAEYLADQRAEFDSIALCNIPEASPTFTLFPKILENHGFTTAITIDEVCPIIHLPESWEGFLESMDKKQRHELRRKLRRAEGVLNDVSWYTVDHTHNLNDELDKFIDLMAKSTPDKAKFLQDEQHVRFFKTFMPMAMNCGWLQLSFLTVDDAPVATYLNFDYNNRILVYNSGLDHQQHGHLSPGIVLICHIIRHAIENGREVFDFLRGNEEYKYRLGAADTTIYRISAQLKV